MVLRKHLPLPGLVLGEAQAEEEEKEAAPARATCIDRLLVMLVRGLKEIIIGFRECK